MKTYILCVCAFACLICVIGADEIPDDTHFSRMDRDFRPLQVASIIIHGLIGRMNEIILVWQAGRRFPSTSIWKKRQQLPTIAGNQSVLISSIFNNHFSSEREHPISPLRSVLSTPELRLSNNGSSCIPTLLIKHWISVRTLTPEHTTSITEKNLFQLTKQPTFDSLNICFLHVACTSYVYVSSCPTVSTIVIV